MYLYEYNNYECCINLDGDKGAIKEVAEIWGWDVDSTIKRMRAFFTIDELKNEE